MRREDEFGFENYLEGLKLKEGAALPRDFRKGKAEGTGKDQSASVPERTRSSAAGIKPGEDIREYVIDMHDAPGNRISMEVPEDGCVIRILASRKPGAPCGKMSFTVSVEK